MEEGIRVEAKTARRRRAGKTGKRYTPQERVRAVRLHLQEGYPAKLVCEEVGMSMHAFWYWVKVYRQRGEAGLSGRGSPRPARRLPEPVRAKIVELKRRHRWYGVKRIAQALQRWFLLKASAESVRQTLHQAGLMEKRRRARRNLTRPRFFERASPNQMWQSDLFTFRLGGKYAYVVAFLDDYSRYVVSLGLYRSPTAEAVIETYRRAVGEYSAPKEMLTDRGRQYTSWRGKSRFECELQKDRVAHIVSAPQHPMTLGKIERFWATMWQEFLVRAQFNSFEKAQAVLAIWTERVKIAEVMRMLGVPYMSLQQWQQRAMEGMLQALEPRTNLADGAALSPRLRALLKRQQAGANAHKLQERLKRVTEVAAGEPPVQV